MLLIYSFSQGFLNFSSWTQTELMLPLTSGTQHGLVKSRQHSTPNTLQRKTAHFASRPAVEEALVVE